MIRILKDCRLCGMSVHAGESFHECDFKEADVQVIVGAGFAERFTPAEPEPEDFVPEEPEDFTVAPVKEPTTKKTTRKKAKK